MSNPVQPENQRLDKWLWAARFFKTRPLAAEAINGGKVHLNGQRTKPAKEVKVGAKLQIHKDSLEWNITVKALPKQRRPASEAIHFYRESEESRLRRERFLEEQRQLQATNPRPTAGRPNKRERRMIHRFTHKEG